MIHCAPFTKNKLPAVQLIVPSFVNAPPLKVLFVPVAAVSVEPLVTFHVPENVPAFQSAAPDSAALFPENVPLLKSRLVELIAPLNAALLLMALMPAPVNALPELNVALLPLNAIVPVWASIVPLLTKVLAIVVLPSPADFRKIPLLLKVDVAPPALFKELSPVAFQSDWLLIVAPLTMNRLPACQFTVPD